jgi:hypothetical protein
MVMEFTRVGAAWLRQHRDPPEGQSVNETAGCAFTRVPTRGSMTELKEPYGALPRK